VTVSASASVDDPLPQLVIVTHELPPVVVPTMTLLSQPALLMLVTRWKKTKEHVKNMAILAHLLVPRGLFDEQFELLSSLPVFFPGQESD
jgi:hypothetical protein